MEKIQKKSLICTINQKKEIVAFFSCSDDSALGDLVTRWVSKWVRDLLENITTEWPQRLVTLRNIWSEWWDDMTWPKTKTNTKTKTITKTNTLKEHPQRTILVTCDIQDTNYNSDNWELEFLTIFVTLQLMVTLDNIRNSCNVFGMSRSHVCCIKWFLKKLLDHF